MKEASPPCARRICGATSNATSSQESEAGPMRCASPDGPTTNQCGPEAAHASLSLPLEGAEAKMMNDICGPSGSSSLESAALQSFLESRLQQLLPKGGSIPFTMTWRVKATPLGRRYCRLAVSKNPTNEIGYGLWPTPRAAAAQHAGRTWNFQHKGQTGLEEIANGTAAMASLWATPDCSDRRGVNSKQVGLSNQAKALCGSYAPMEKLAPLNPAFVCWLMGYPPVWEDCADMVTLSYRK